MNLVIVESPTKAKTLSRFLGKGYEVVASMGHIRDLPSNKMNIDIKKGFEPFYALAEGKGKVVKQLQDVAKKSGKVFLAMDPDREGEAIAWHVHYILLKSLKVKKDFRRISFHQITKDAVEEAIGKAGRIDMNLVDAQQARRVLDRLVGYSLSPVLWRKVRRGLSAGRVQSVALRLIVEREREVEAFKSQEYWEVGVLVGKAGGSHGSKDGVSTFWVNLVDVGGKRIVEGKGDERSFMLSGKRIAEPVVADLKKASYTVEKVTKKEKRSSPRPPYTTSTLQQAAANSLGWTAKQTMSVAQKLYERGWITYHRTDSLHLAPQAVSQVRDFAKSKYGDDFVPEKPRFYKTQSKSAQEAHEAIRPTDVAKHGLESGKLEAKQNRLYGLIWRRFVSSQMASAVFDATTIDVVAKGKKKYGLRASGAIMKFEGWKVVYRKSNAKKPETRSEDTSDGTQKRDEDVVLPQVDQGEGLKYKDIDAQQKFTQPPARYNDASLVKALEQLGIGRPSTYAPTVSTLLGRGYMERLERRFHPTVVGTTVTDFLAKNFGEIMDYGFTANMEDDLDKIAEGKRKWVPVIKEFWGPFDKKVLEVTDKAKRVKVPVEKVGRKCPKCGRKEGGELVIRTGRFGKFISCSRFPECKHTEKLKQVVRGLKCEKCGEGKIEVKKTRTGRTFWGCDRYPECDWASWTDPKKGHKPNKKK